MPRNITVTFQDGTNHVYQNAPDDITPEAVQARAQKEFGKQIIGLDGGRTSTQPSAPQEEPGFLSRVGSDLSERGANIGKMIGRQTAGGFVDGVKNIPTMAALASGQVAGGINDIAGEGLVSAYRGVVPKEAREGISRGVNYLAQTAPGKTIGNALQGGKEAYGKFSTEYPDAAMALEGAGNIVGLAYGAKSGESLVPKPTPESLAKKYSSVVQSGIEKGIRPTVSGKGTFSRASGAAAKAEDAVTEIINRKADLSLKNDLGEVLQGELPKNLSQFADAIEQTKRNIYQEYNTMAQQSGQNGVVFNVKPIAEKLYDVASDLKKNPQIRQYADSLSKEIMELHGQPPEVIEARIADLNKSLKGFYEGRIGQAKAEVDASVASLMREQLDNDITSSIGPGYQDLKKRYGALASIEKEVNQRAIVSARANSKGLADLSDIFTGGEILSGAASLLTGNPAGAKGIISGLAGRYIKGSIKDANNADNVIKKMFSKAADIKAKIPQPKPSAPAVVPPTTNALAQQGAPYGR